MKITSIVGWGLIFLLLSFGLLSAGIAPPKEGGILPEITLSVPEMPTHQDYLGITKNKKTFRIPEIKAEIVLIEIFSMYCPYCQKDAPVVNELYNKIAQDGTYGIFYSKRGAIEDASKFLNLILSKAGI